MFSRRIVYVTGRGGYCDARRRFWTHFPPSGRSDSCRRCSSPGEVIGQDVQGHLGGYIRKCVAAIWALIVPKGCSTVSRRVRMASGLQSSRLCTSSITYLCSQSVMRRCFDGVHWLLITRPWHAAVDQ